MEVFRERRSGGQLREQEQADGEAAIRLLRDRLQQRDVPVELIKNTKVPVLILPPDWSKSI